MALLSNKQKGILSLVVAAFGFSTMALLVKLTDNRVPTIQMILFRNSASMILSFILIIITKQRIFGKRQHQKYLLLRSLFGTVGMLLFFYSITNIVVLSDSTMLNKLSSFFLIIFSALFLKEKIKTYQFVAMVVAFIGSIFIIKPTMQFDLLPYTASILGSILAGAAYTMLRFLGNKEHYLTIVFYFSMFSALSITLVTFFVLSPLGIYSFKAMTLLDTLLLIGVGLLATIGQFGTTLAYKYAPANEISLFTYTNVFFSALYTYFIFNTTIDIYSFIGYVFIFSAAYYMFTKKGKD